MSALKKILQDAREHTLEAGGVLSDRVMRKLGAHRQRQFLIFATLEILLVIAIVFSVYYIVTHPKNTTEVKVLSGLIGIGTGGGVEVVRRVWKEWSQTDLLLVLIESASEGQVTAIIDRLIGKL